MPDPIRFIITGGTFDKDYDPLSGKLTFRDTHLPQILREVRLTVPVELEITQLIDSLDMSDEQRNEVVNACARAGETRIIVTHGTDTMTATARLAEERLAEEVAAASADAPPPAGLNAAGTLSGKTIVFTGAMVPYSVSGSDAVFNLGTAVVAVQVLPPGVYVAMNGQVFPAATVRKDTGRGVFEA